MTPRIRNPIEGPIDATVVPCGVEHERESRLLLRPNPSRAIIPLLVLDLPLSFVVDTITLPCTVGVQLGAEETSRREGLDPNRRTLGRSEAIVNSILESVEPTP